MDLIFSEATGWYELPSLIWMTFKAEREALWRAFDPSEEEEELPQISLDKKILVDGLTALTPSEMLHKIGVVDAKTGGLVDLEGIMLVKLAPGGFIRTWIKPRRPYVILESEEDEE